MCNNDEQKASVIVMDCEHCGKHITITKEQVNLRETGYRGGFQAYTVCPECGKKTVINYQNIPEDIMMYLAVIWTSM